MHFFTLHKPKSGLRTNFVPLILVDCQAVVLAVAFAWHVFLWLLSAWWPHNSVGWSPCWNVWALIRWEISNGHVMTQTLKLQFLFGHFRSKIAKWWVFRSKIRFLGFHCHFRLSFWKAIRVKTVYQIYGSLDCHFWISSSTVVPGLPPFQAALHVHRSLRAFSNSQVAEDVRAELSRHGWICGEASTINYQQVPMAILVENGW